MKAKPGVTLLAIATWKRNDYVAIPMAWRAWPTQAWIADNLDFSIAKEDHRAALVRLQMRLFSKPASQSRQSCAKFTFANMAHLPLENLDVQNLDWTLDVHSHAQHLQVGLLRHLAPHRIRGHRQPRKASITPTTWALIVAKRNLRNHLQGAQQQRQRLLCAVCFLSWKTKCSQQSATMLPQLAVLDQHIALAEHEGSQLSRQVSHAMRADDRAFFDGLLRQAQDHLQPQDTKRLWAIIRRSLPRFRQRRLQARPFQREELEDQWEPYFQQLEVGHSTTPQELIDHYRQRTASLRPPQIGLQDLPTLSEIEDSFRQTSAGKSTGLDALPSDLFKTCAASLAKLHYQLILKLFAWQTEPLQWKGGLLHVIPKKLCCSAASHYRGIMLMGTLSKRIHSVLRQRTIRALMPHRPPGQLGGFAGQQVLFGQQSLRILNHICNKAHVSSAVVFLDLRNAFHKLVRETVLGIAWNPDFDHVIHALQEARCPTDALLAGRQLPAVLARLGAPEALIGFLQDIHSETWFKLHSHHFPRLCHTKCGTRPGSPLADVIFHAAMVELGGKVDAWLDLQPDITQIRAEWDILSPCVIWADDIAIPLFSRHADHLVPLIQSCLTFATNLFADWGFQLNFDHGKSGAVVAFRGTGSAALRKHFMLRSKPGTHFTTTDGQQWLHFDAKYKHLGALFSADAGLQEELCQRIGQARSAFQLVSRPLLTNRHLPLRLRLRLFNALILSKLFFGLGAWDGLTEAQTKKIQTAIARMLKKVLRLRTDAVTLSSTEILAKADIPEVRVRLAIDRL